MVLGMSTSQESKTLYLTLHKNQLKRDPHEIKKKKTLLHYKGNIEILSKETAYSTKENHCQLYIWQRTNILSIESALINKLESKPKL